MTLSFWHEGENTPNSVNPRLDHRQDMTQRQPYELLKENGDRKLRVPGLQEVDLISTSESSPFNNISEARDESGYKVSVLKNWCEEELTPLAWQRALVRTLPALREFGYELDNLQNPTNDTRIDTAYYRVICVALSELYNTNGSAA